MNKQFPLFNLHDISPVPPLCCLSLTFPQVLLLGFAAHAVDPWHGLHVALVNGWRVQNGLGCPSQADRQTCSAHQDTCHT